MYKPDKWGRLKFGDTIVSIFKDFTVTKFRDGTEIVAQHEEHAEQRKTALKIRYIDAFEMNKEHDITHSALAEMLGLPHSPTLWDVAHNIPADELHDIEEEAVLAVQKFHNAVKRLRK